MKKILIIAIAAILITGCRKNLLDTSPYGSIGSSNMWTTDNLTDLGVTGVYQALRNGIDGSSASMRELYQFDRYAFTGQTRDADGFTSGTATSGSGLVSGVWQDLYEGIHRANDAIYNIKLTSPSTAEKKARYTAECKFLRAYYYFRLNQLWKGVPVYLEPVLLEQMNRPRETEQKVWDVIIQDLTDCINEPNLPVKYAAGNANYGHVTKGAAYALRGKAYLYQKKWSEAAADLSKVKDAGYSLFPNYFQLFKAANEQCNEMIFSIQNIGVAGYGSSTQKFCGTRSSFGSCWNTFLVSPNLADLYENKDGSKFSWDNIIPGYSTMPAAKREVFFLRDNLTAAEINAATARGLDMSLYFPTGNEARIKTAYANRDPRLAYNVITPYSTYNGNIAGVDLTATMRWPFRNQSSPLFDLQTDTRNYFFYLHRKFVYEGGSELLDRSYGPTDFPIIRYADVILMWAEAVNEQAFSQDAVDLVNQVRQRAGVAPLQTTDPAAPAYVSNQSDMRNTIRDERRREFPNEGITYFDELRWKTWKEKVFYPGAGVKQVWGSNTLPYNWQGDYIYTWPIPKAEREKNPKLTQNDGWMD